MPLAMIKVKVRSHVPEQFDDGGSALEVIYLTEECHIGQAIRAHYRQTEVTSYRILDWELCNEEIHPLAPRCDRNGNWVD